MVTWAKEGQVYDALREHFGVGDWTEESGVPFWKYRMTEVSKIKAMMRKRNVSYAELHQAYDFAVANGRPITESWHLFQLIPEAKKAAREQEQAVPTDVRTALDEAAVEAHEAGEEGWAQSLLAADAGEGGKALLEGWREQHG